ncbi:copper amine oxidase N-terminal domain-containing protein [Brevibacillus sp. M2.1A]|uniref:copper amine oxidase N-terminal domain-containing protein n=1 Tax=Brevibacillus sp. M2.1A TaxID=2738980 RepID=UPI00156ABF5B|nr:copper amine oxidase N-terminal domain-containing protein [Brevibacillus sp. M2.1A]MCC8435860.1 copper amine oxidase N-terminal domain-containing protein [Brevibacillus sp. M2.1A]
MVKMVRLLACFLAIFFIFFASVPESEGAELKANVIVDSMIYGRSEDNNTFFIYALLLNLGEATATNFSYAGLSFEGKNGMDHFYPETSHTVINSSLKLEPGHFVEAKFELPLDFIDSRFKNINDIKKISILILRDNSAPYKDDSAVTVTVNNKKLVQQTFIENDVTYVSLRELADVLGATIQWNDPTQTATLILRDNFMEYDRQIVIPVGSDRFIDQGRETTVSGKAKLYNNTTLVVPLRDIVEMLDYYVVFEHKGGQKTIVVIPNDLLYR